ncbi:hypothetical protein SeMB42_g03766 [Synchytrium endobioticum]|nr:hypothetical protein SeMB42_g03766 [Synchytrium endobioticum]
MDEPAVVVPSNKKSKKRRIESLSPELNESPFIKRSSLDVGDVPTYKRIGSSIGSTSAHVTAPVSTANTTIELQSSSTLTKARTTTSTRSPTSTSSPMPRQKSVASQQNNGNTSTPTSLSDRVSTSPRAPPSIGNRPTPTGNSPTPTQAALAAIRKLQQQRPASASAPPPPGAVFSLSQMIQKQGLSPAPQQKTSGSSSLSVTPGRRLLSDAGSGGAGSSATNDSIQKALAASQEAIRLVELERQQRAREEAEQEMQRRIHQENDRIIRAAQDAERERRRQLEVDYEYAKMRGQNIVKPPSSRAPKEELVLNVDRLQQLLPSESRNIYDVDKRAREAIWAKSDPLLHIIPDQGDIVNSIERDQDEYDEHRIAAVSRNRIRDSIVADLLAGRVTTVADDATHKEFVDESLVQAVTDMEDGEIA